MNVNRRFLYWGVFLVAGRPPMCFVMPTYACMSRNEPAMANDLLCAATSMAR